MKILIACECSGIVRNSFRARGHDVWSCDLKADADDSPYHIQGDVIAMLADDDSWDLVIAHPPCTYLCVSGLHWNKRRPERVTLTDAAVRFFMVFTELKCRWAIENP